MMNQIRCGRCYTSGWCLNLVIVQRHVDDVGKSSRTTHKAAHSLLSVCFYHNSLSCYIFIQQILIQNVFLADKRHLSQKAGFTTQGNRATCTPNGGKANTTTTTKLKGQNRYPIIFYGCRENTDQYELNCVFSTPCFSQYLSQASFQKKDTNVLMKFLVDRNVD